MSLIIKNKALFLILNAIPVGGLFFINLYLIEKFLNESISPFFPTIALFALCFELGVPHLLASSRLKVSTLTNFLFLKKKNVFLLFLLAILIFCSANIVIGRHFFENLYLFPVFLIFSFSGLFLVIFRAINDRVKNYKDALLCRYTSILSGFSGVLLSLIGFSDAICLIIATLIRAPFIPKIFYFLKYRKRATPNEIQEANSAIYKVALSAVMAFIISGFIFRFIVSVLYDYAYIILFAYGSELAVKIAGFTNQALLPFYRDIKNFVPQLVVLSVLFLMLCFYVNITFIHIIAMAQILFTASLLLQKSIELKQYNIRLFFPIIELIIFFSISMYSIYALSFNNILIIWICSQLISNFLLILYQKVVA